MTALIWSTDDPWDSDGQGQIGRRQPPRAEAATNTIKLGRAESSGPVPYPKRSFQQQGLAGTPSPNILSGSSQFCRSFINIWLFPHLSSHFPSVPPPPSPSVFLLIHLGFG